MYLQLHLARYINATGSGTGQLEALVGPAAVGGEEPVSMTFSCFGESVGLFKDAFWTDIMTANANRISKVGRFLEDHSIIGQVAATVLFYQDKTFPPDDLDEPTVVARSYETFKHDIISFGKRGRDVDAVMETLNSMAHLYAAHANLN